MAGVYTWMVHCGRARRTRDAWSTPRTMSAARTSTIPEGSTMISSAGPPWRPRVCKATAACPAWVTRSMAPRCSRCRVRSHPGSSPAPPNSVGRRVRPRVPPRAALRYRGRAWGGCLGHQPSPVQWPRFHAVQRLGTLPAGGAGSAGVLPVEGSGISSRSESVPAFSCGGSPSPPLSPSAPMTSCAASSVGDRGRVLRGAAGSPLLCRCA